MRNFILILTAVLAVSCSLFEEGNHLGKSRSDAIPGSPRDTSAWAPQPDTTIYISGVEYPSGYDWSRDTANGTVACSLVVFANFKRVLEVPAGPSHEVSPDFDMHHLLGGHLYTQYSTDSSTVVKRDGKELFRYPGREMICGLMVKDGVVHTIGQNRSGAGLSYRRDGVKIFSRPSGTVIGGLPDASFPTGALYEDSGAICFSYRQSIHSTAGHYDEYYMVKDTVASKIQLGTSVTEVFDIRMIGGKLCVLVKTTSRLSAPVLYIDNETYALGYDTFVSAKHCRLLPSGDGLLVKGEQVFTNGTVTPALWSKEGLLNAFDEYLTVYDFYTDNGTVSYVGSRSEGYATLICDGCIDEKYILQGRYRFISSACASAHDGKFYVALTGERSALWVDGKMTELDFNGYLTGVEVLP